MQCHSISTFPSTFCCWLCQLVSCLRGNCLCLHCISLSMKEGLAEVILTVTQAWGLRSVKMFLTLWTNVLLLLFLFVIHFLSPSLYQGSIYIMPILSCADVQVCLWKASFVFFNCKEKLCFLSTWIKSVKYFQMYATFNFVPGKYNHYNLWFLVGWIGDA